MARSLTVCECLRTAGEPAELTASRDPLVQLEAGISGDIGWAALRPSVHICYRRSVPSLSRMPIPPQVPPTGLNSRGETISRFVPITSLQKRST
jgi:hypothetical protein